MAEPGKVRSCTSRPTSASASTRPTSAGSGREGSPGRPSLALSQRPTSAGSAQDSAGRPSMTSLYRPTSARSRPGSAKSQPACRASLEGPEGSTAAQAAQAAHVPARGESPTRGGRLLGPHSLESTVTQGADYGRRALEEELQQPVLTPIPNSIATSLEKQLGTAIGLKGRNRLVPRLPRDVVHCLHGQSCCWRWLARAAMEEASGSSFASMSLADSIAMIKQELLQLREEHAIKEAERGRAEAAEENLASLKAQLAATKVDHKEFRALERAQGQLQEEAASLRISAGSLSAQLEVQKKEAARELAAVRGKADAEVSALRLRAEKAETELAKVQVAESELRQRVAELIEGRDAAERKKLSPLGPRRFKSSRRNRCSAWRTPLSKQCTCSLVYEE
ncbi:unnamed protein product [Symbiodinium pilosum]|uniref:Uncharacterized protein n=1 Tax=Symbiodinium pilosum TaxID=2952 RepID=A0A812WN63_SYMPI|nr:unnamed protein product [Symbiodinium pilosum]